MLANKSSVSRTFEKFSFLWELDGSKTCTSGPTLNFRYPLKMAEIEKKYNSRKALTIELSKDVKTKVLSSLPFLELIQLLFVLFGLFSVGNRARSHVQASHSKFDILPIFTFLHFTNLSWLRGVVVVIIAQLHSTKPELRFCAGSNPARSVSEIRGEDLWQLSRLEIRLNAFRRSSIPQKQFIIIIITNTISGQLIIIKKLVLAFSTFANLGGREHFRKILAQFFEFCCWSR